MNIEDKYSDKNLTNTEAQTIQRTLNDEDINFNDNNIDEKVSEEIINKLKNIVNTAPKLELKILESLYFQEGFTIKINALGLIEKSLRHIKDGNTFFGIISSNDEQNSKNIDFSTGNEKIENQSNKDNNDNNIHINYGRQFVIRYDLDDNCYFIKDCSMSSGYGTFMKIINEIKIKDNTLINIGNNYLVFTFGVDSLEPEENDIITNEKEKILSIKVFRGELTNYSYVFNQSQIDKIYIGNNEECNIVLNDNLSDDFHCSIEYKKDIGWVICDGYHNKYSENGTWICLSEETKITEGMIIQSNQNIYQCHIIEE